MHKAEYYRPEEDNKLKCLLCPHECLISLNKRGICQGRLNQEGELITENYGMVSSLGIDPIEKKPLYHFYPGREVLSVGTFGCNFRCEFCQNWQISQEKPELREILPTDLVKLALDRETLGIAYTYSEPSVWYEYILDASRLARKQGLQNILVTNGYLNQEPLKELLPYLDGVNIDLKSFTEDFYHRVCGGHLEPVLENIKLIAASEDTHLELTTLIIPGLNDSTEELKDLFSWVKGVGADIPLHLSRYFPRYRLQKPPTPVKRMEETYNLAKEYLDYVYLGNLRTDYGSNTICPQCREIVIIREGYYVDNKLDGDKCPVCGKEISGVFQ
ncbi:MAG: pyruvate formate lyase activating enzyme [Halanaerobiales bacterium]|nr:pyruvate formate lyase activating enzyme [Halanaerobiales bacterium]